MRESGYYPPGAEFDPRAPWNQIEAEICADCEGTGEEKNGEKCWTCQGTGYVDYSQYDE